MTDEEKRYAFFGPRRGIAKGDIVYHQLSKLLFRCENYKHERWMNMNPFYLKTTLTKIDYSKIEGLNKQLDNNQ